MAEKKTPKNVALLSAEYWIALRQSGEIPSEDPSYSKILNRISKLERQIARSTGLQLDDAIAKLDLVIWLICPDLFQVPEMEPDSERLRLPAIGSKHPIETRLLLSLAIDLRRLAERQEFPQ